MNGWRGNYIKAFIAIIGLALIFVGITLLRFLEQKVVGSLFMVLGFIVIGIVVYLLYKNFQKGV
ncbi:hypothetical protein A2865_02135 [Candidatus Woesebacteria bacterium RIFCSPHIGHO2_01_FULL_39_17]|uniref:Uncharacterized protein n=2 Tax=Candidatus Woeseibacteriota TaxID=1752722 RepID=A0A0G0LNZ3_9BACT|nr:MAG: hypothetical protein UT19_C0009G0002 [Candidatus Woesebacteria bacterium GW2011_GWB1_39_10b]OGM23107.1 MAG: hypothetical protein A2865_02135 [Candidatus Woesebacteria bacterium RIFCSPHIGHO2_01_FULL_39_17]OGM61567.1 MAG: hypothetical protein A3A52_02885 [Candidatus Woesebacteria bacterium RIFCSPLOWO2_01_FULL_39_14]